MAVSSGNDIENVELYTTMDNGISVPAENAAVWHSGNLPAWGNTAVITSRFLSTIGLGPGDVNAQNVANTLQNYTYNASRIRRGHFYKSADGTNPGFNGCTWGDSGTQITALTNSYRTYLSGSYASQIKAAHDINTDTDVDAIDLNAAVSSMASKLSTHRAGSAYNFPSCHCSCHSNCHGSRNRR